MKRLSITIENYDNTKKVCSSLLRHSDDQTAFLSILERTGVEVSVENVEGELFDFNLDDGDRSFELSLRTKKEIESWIMSEAFEVEAKRFLEAGDPTLGLNLGDGGILKISRRSRELGF